MDDHHVIAVSRSWV